MRAAGIINSQHRSHRRPAPPNQRQLAAVAGRTGRHQSQPRQHLHARNRRRFPSRTRTAGRRRPLRGRNRTDRQKNKPQTSTKPRWPFFPSTACRSTKFPISPQSAANRATTKNTGSASHTSGSGWMRTPCCAIAISKQCASTTPMPWPLTSMHRRRHWGHHSTERQSWKKPGFWVCVYVKASAGQHWSMRLARRPSTRRSRSSATYARKVCSPTAPARYDLLLAVSCFRTKSCASFLLERETDPVAPQSSQQDVLIQVL